MDEHGYFFNAEARRGNESYAEGMMMENENTQAAFGTVIKVHQSHKAASLWLGAIIFNAEAQRRNESYAEEFL